MTTPAYDLPLSGGTGGEHSLAVAAEYAGLPLNASKPMNQEELDRAAGLRLKELRQKAGMSQEDLSFAAHVDQSTLSKVERVGPSAISWPRFVRIARELGQEVEIVLRPASNNR